MERCVSDLGAESNLNFLTFTGTGINTKTNRFEINVIQELNRITRIDIEDLKDLVTVEKLGSAVNKVKLCVKNQDLKSALIKEFRKRKPVNYYLSEYLSKHNSALAAKLREVKRNGKIASVYSFLGRVYYKVTKESTGILVRTFKEIELIK